MWFGIIDGGGVGWGGDGVGVGFLDRAKRI